MKHKKLVEREYHFSLKDLDNKTVAEVMQYFEGLEVDMIRKGYSDFKFFYSELDSYFYGTSIETNDEYGTRVEIEDGN